MKLSSLLSYKSILQEMMPLDTAPLAHNTLSPAVHTVKTNDLQFSNLTEQLEQQYRTIVDHLCAFEQTMESVVNEIDAMVQQYEPAYYATSTELYQQMCAYDTEESLLDRRLNPTETVAQFLTARIQAHGDWHHAGLILRPGREDWINLLVACDPLYLMDTDAALLDPAVLRFNDQYQRRLRTYTISESADQPMLDALPTGQFGFCLAYYFFNFKPIEIVRAYLHELYGKLKPGGTLAFTFNDGDRAGGVSLAERSFMCYTPRRAVMAAAEALGFEIQQSYRIDAACTWLEFRKPGQLTSIKGGQTLATLTAK